MSQRDARPYVVDCWGVHPIFSPLYSSYNHTCNDGQLGSAALSGAAFSFFT